jgi:hypothetical protein
MKRTLIRPTLLAALLLLTGLWILHGATPGISAAQTIHPGGDRVGNSLSHSDLISNTLYLPALSANSASPTPTPEPTLPPPSDNPLSPEEQMAAVESMAASLSQVIDTSLPFEERNLLQEVEAAAQEMLKAPNVATVLLFTETLSVQAVLVDGTSILLNNNRPPGAEPDSGRMGDLWRAQAGEMTPRLAADNVPSSRRYVATAFDGGASVAAAVGSLLTGKGYVSAGLGPSIENMKNYRNLGALYLDTHGTGWTLVNQIRQNPDGSYNIQWGESSYGLQSSTRVNAQVLGTTYKADLEAGRLIISFVEVNGKHEAMLSITERFIRAYWDLDDAIVMIHSCFGGAGPFTSQGQCYGNCENLPNTVFDPRPIRSAILSAGARVVVGFDNYTNADVGRSSILFFFDRLLGSNEQAPTSPPTRPFDFAEVWGEMGRRNLTTFQKPAWTLGSFGIGGNQVNMTFDAAPAGGSSTALAPSIRYVDVIDDAGESAGQVEIYGSFGEKEGKVEVDGRDIPVTSWSKNKIVAAPPWNGLGSRGYLVVKANDSVRSNFIPFTEWRGSVTLTYEPGAGNLQAEAEANIRVRADLHPYRESINGAPQPRETQRAYFTRGSTANSSASGSYTEDGNTLQYLGGTTLPILSKAQIDAFANAGRSAQAGDQSVFTPYIGGFIDLNAQNRTARLCLTVSAPFTQRTISEEGTQDFPSAIFYVAGLGLEDSVQGLLSCYNLGMASDYSLPAGSRTLSIGDGASFRIEWTSFTPFAEPTDRTPG